MCTPVRAVWPLPARPPVLLLPEPMPRPIRMRPLRAPALSESWFNFMVLSSVATAHAKPAPIHQIVASAVGFHSYQVLHLGDHAAHGGRVLELAAAMQLVEAESDQRGPLNVRPAERAADMGDADAAFRGRHDLLPRLGAGVAPAQYFAHLLAATGGHGARRRAAAERREGGLDHVVRIGGANRLGDHVVNAERLEDGPHRPAGDDAGPGHGDAEHDAAGAIVPDHVMMQ